jgi:hypothetical protein
MFYSTYTVYTVPWITGPTTTFLIKNAESYVLLNMFIIGFFPFLCQWVCKKTSATPISLEQLFFSRAFFNSVNAVWAGDLDTQWLPEPDFSGVSHYIFLSTSGFFCWKRQLKYSEKIRIWVLIRLLNFFSAAMNRVDYFNWWFYVYFWRISREIPSYTPCWPTYTAKLTYHS